ncbi:AVAST type 1 anti-phage system protein Avs1c [Clostridium felsineum]|uniref:AVAST type 1 anti-phage system protein Avs1c n=1 Tax=Clostridium felsineum TaxID=36839 RepID=UPI0009C95249|nr:AVAST type 1 anti-phage system protein Avs1c [Clostridium felsineum]URZ16687.1 hypothetical protein CLFE_027340 [Clostridium felsineum DSM 794]
MNTNAMNIPHTRKEFEHRMNLLEVAIRDGKMKFASQCLGVVDSLMKVRRMDNGRIDLLTVDEAARLQANMMSNSIFDMNMLSNEEG